MMHDRFHVCLCDGEVRYYYCNTNLILSKKMSEKNTVENDSSFHLDKVGYHCSLIYPVLLIEFSL